MQVGGFHIVWVDQTFRREVVIQAGVALQRGFGGFILEMQLAARALGRFDLGTGENLFADGHVGTLLKICGPGPTI
ncbi:hypothetical protein D3C86_1286000 [compost metagenome]